MTTRSTSYRLRASAPQPLKGNCSSLNEPAPTTISFVIQTFLAEKTETDTCEDKTELLCSNDMLGLGGQYVTASYTAQRFLDPDTNEIIFQSTEAKEAVIIDEDDVPGIGGL